MLRFNRSSSQSEFRTPPATRLLFAVLALANLAFAVTIMGRPSQQTIPPIANIDRTKFQAVSSIAGEWKLNWATTPCDDPSTPVMTFGDAIEIKNATNKKIFSPRAKYALNDDRLIMEYDAWNKTTGSWVRMTELMAITKDTMEPLGAWIDGQGGLRLSNHEMNPSEKRRYTRCR